EREAGGLLAFLVPYPNMMADKPRVLQALRTNETINEPVRQKALALTDAWLEDPYGLAQESWGKVSAAGKEAALYEEALGQAELAFLQLPDQPFLPAALRAASHRCGKYREADDALRRAEQLTPKDIYSLAFHVLLHQQCGRKELARVSLDRLRELLPNDP